MSARLSCFFMAEDSKKVRTEIARKKAAVIMSLCEYRAFPDFH